MALIRRALATISTAVVLLASVTGAAQCEPGPVESVPVAAGQMQAITTEGSYSGFPDVTKDAAGRLWVVYRSGANHAGADGHVRLRFRDPGKGWSEQSTVIAATATHMYGTGGLVVDAAADGGRLWLGLAKADSTGTNTATDYQAQVMWRDPANGNWSTPVSLPAIAPGSTVMTGVYLHEGQLLATAYGVPTGASHWVARVYGCTRTPVACTARGTVSIAGRSATEPTLVTLADGRLLMLIRSDTNQPYYSYIYASVSSDDGATWSTPYKVAQHSTGLPAAYRLATGEIAFLYRGFSEPVNPPSGSPMRIGMLHPDGTAQRSLTEQGHDVVAGDPRRFLYGAILPADSPLDATVVFALESPVGSTSVSSATVYELPIRWLTRSS